MAPESIRFKEYSQASDVWAFGVTIWEVLVALNDIESKLNDINRLCQNQIHIQIWIQCKRLWR